MDKLTRIKLVAVPIFFMIMIFNTANIYALEFNVKQVPQQNILVVEYNGEGHIAPYFGKLVAYYNKQNTPFTVVFPQMSIEFSPQKQWIAVAYKGKAVETDDIKLKQLPAVNVATVVHRGPYETLSETVRELYQSLYAQKKFPSSSEPLRLLYLNSPDDNHAADLITEIQIPIE